MSIGIYDPRVRAEAQRSGITDLQAWRKLNAAEVIKAREVENRRGVIRKFVSRVCDDFEKKNPDWNHY